MKAALLRFARIIVAQAITWGLSEWGGVVIPVLNIGIGAFVNAIFKAIRDKYPKTPFLEWLPL